MKTYLEETDAVEIVQVVFGCKWALKILKLIRQGICRPGAIESKLEGLTSRVKNYTFRRMIALGLLKKVVYPKVPPHVEYHLTPLGKSLLPILDSIEQLQHELELTRKNLKID